MRKFCAQGIEVQYGKELTAFAAKIGGDGFVEAAFRDGTNATGSVLIGTDGHRSKVRELLLGAEKGSVIPIPGGTQLVGMSVCYNDAEKARHVRQLHPINWAAFDGDKSLSIWTASTSSPYISHEPHFLC